MFISIKWKALLFLSLVTVIIFVAWITQYIFKTLSDFESQKVALYERQQMVLEQLVNDNFLRLSQLSQLIAEAPDIGNADLTSQTTDLGRLLQRKWIKLNINTGIDFIGVYSLNGKPLGEAFNTNFFLEPDSLGEAITRSFEGMKTSASAHFIYCDYGCSQFVVEPFVSETYVEGMIILGQNMADIIQRFKQVTASDIAVLMKQEVGEPDSLQSERWLSVWQKRVWAASQFVKTLRHMKQLEKTVPMTELDQSHLHPVGQNELLFNELNIPSTLDLFGASPEIYAFTDYSAKYDSVQRSIQYSLFTGGFALIVAELVLLLLMLKPLRRLVSVVRALKLLPSHQYKEAKRMISKEKVSLPDELTTLEISTRYVTGRLETLHDEVQEKNRSLKNQLAIISRSRAFLERLIDSSHLLISTIDCDGNILTANTRFQNQFGGAGVLFFDIFGSMKDRHEFTVKWQKLVAEEAELTQFDGEFLNQAGKALFLNWTISSVEDEVGNRIILAIGLDLTERKKDQEALQWLAYHDPLTGIGNRRAFQRDLASMLQNFDMGAVIFIDVNRFKQINDLYGHHVGDAVLTQITEALKVNVRGKDSICRLAGDEFTIVLPNIDRSHLAVVMEKLADKLSGSVDISEQKAIEFQVSLGAVLVPDHGNTEQMLVAHADMAMYQAKKGAVSWQIFDPENNELATLRKDHDLTAMIKTALSEEDRFVLCFQPILRIQDSSVSHYEVLLRMKDGGGGLVPPADFIPAAERMGLIHRVDEWVIENAIKKLVKESQQGRQISFAVNVSAPSLQSADFPKMLSSLIDRYKLDPSRLVVELTETAYIENFQMVLSNLNHIDRLGVRVALDDFGVGFSSFSYLKKLPLSYVKLDGSYIKDLENNIDNQVFVQSLTHMVNAFGMRTIAEFVEDEVTLRKLAELNVDYAQGYYIGKPETEPEIVDLSSTNQKMGLRPE